MKTTLHSGVEIHVKNEFQKHSLALGANEFWFTYEVSILNKNNFNIRLLRRYWRIVDANGGLREVEGEGVVGELPTIDSGNLYKYSSGCNFATELGTMSGYYLMENQLDGSYFRAIIPNFTLVVPYRLN